MTVILTLDAQYADDAVIEKEAAAGRAAIETHRLMDAAGAPDAVLAHADGLIVWQNIRADEALFARMGQLRVIVRAGVGTDNIDLKEAGRRGLPVCNVPDYGTTDVADHTMALLLALVRGVAVFHQDLISDPVKHYDHSSAPFLRRLRGRTLGIVGIGPIGIAVGERAKAFGMRVLACDPYAARGIELALGFERTDSLEQLLTDSDAITLHCPLTPETQGLIGRTAFRHMKREAVLLNTARGGLVDLDALFEALKDGRLAAAALDVLPKEPPEWHPLITAYRQQPDWLKGRLILTPHAAWNSLESRADLRRKSIGTALGYLLDGQLLNCVNRAFLKSAERPATSLAGRRVS